MRRFVIIFVSVVLVVLVSGLVLNTFMVGGKGFVGLPVPIAQWPRALPPIPGLRSANAGPTFSIVGLMIDFAVWTTIAVVIQRLTHPPRS